MNATQEQSEVTQTQIQTSSSHVFTVEFNGEHYQTVYPEPLGELSQMYEDKTDAYYALVLDRVTQKVGSQWPYENAKEAAGAIWEKLEQVIADEDDCIESEFLTFPAGTYKFEIHHWIESHFNICIGTDL